MCDPSCSGSGIVSRGDHFRKTKKGGDEEEDEKKRLAGLAAFQKNVVKKAMSFPGVEFVVYSTCSIHDVENEEVVKDVLESEEVKLHFFFFFF